MSSTLWLILWKSFSFRVSIRMYRLISQSKLKLCWVHVIKDVSQQLLTLTLNALLNPLAKKPPNGAINELKSERMMEWNCIGYSQTSSCVKPPYKQNMKFSKQLCISTNNSTNIFLHWNQQYKQTFHEAENCASVDSWGHVFWWHLVVESGFFFFFGGNELNLCLENLLWPFTPNKGFRVIISFIHLKTGDLQILGNIWLVLGWCRLSVYKELKAHKLSWNLWLSHWTEEKESLQMWDY